MSIGEVEKEAVLDLIPLLSEGGMIFDVGSNKGQWSDILMSVPDKAFTFHFFEPNKIMLDFTRIKYDYNTNIKYNELAVWSEDNKELDFFYFTNLNNGLSSVLHNAKWDYLPMQKGTVKTTTLDAYCKINGIEYVDFIKIDIEGAEAEALFGCRELLESKKVKFIQVEYSEHYKLANIKFTDIITYVESLGYFVYSHNGISFKKETLYDFVEDYRLENFIITRKLIENKQNWNDIFVKNTSLLPKMNFVLEIGCFEGITSKYICENLLNKECWMVAIDPLEDVYLTENITSIAEQMNKEFSYFNGQYDRFLINTRGLPIILHRKTFSNSLNEIKDCRFDLIYIDGDHRPDAVYFDAVNSFNLLQTKGYILFDDYEWDNGNTKIGIDKFLNEYQEHIHIISINEQVLIRKNT